jgi:L-asparaginase
MATGGTISSRSRQGRMIATDDASNLLERSSVSGVEVASVDVMRLGSYQMQHGDLRVLTDAVREAMALTGDDAITGIVITHGTDTIEESAVLLDLVHDDPRPVVFTGAQRSADTPDTDGPRNLADAITLASSPLARGLGVLVSFAGAVFAARGTRKVHTTSPLAFATPDSGAIGHVRNGLVVITMTPRRSPAFATPTASFDTTRVDVVNMHPGADDALIRASVRAGARGVVIAGSGLGNSNPSVVAAVDELTRDGIVFCLSTRVGAGPVEAVYGNGGGADLVSAGAMIVPGLPAFQARILLALLLSAQNVTSDVRRMLRDFA